MTVSVEEYWLFFNNSQIPEECNLTCMLCLGNVIMWQQFSLWELIFFWKLCEMFCNATPCRVTVFCDVTPCRVTVFYDVTPCTVTVFCDVTPCRVTVFCDVILYMVTVFWDVTPCRVTVFCNVTLLKLVCMQHPEETALEQSDCIPNHGWYMYRSILNLWL